MENSIGGIEKNKMKYSKFKRGVIEELWLWYEAILSVVPGRLGYKIRWLGFAPFAKRIASSTEIREGCHIWHIHELIVGGNTRIGRQSIINAAGGVEIGCDVRIGPRLLISSTDHKYSIKSKVIRSQGSIKKKVVIGDNVWIGANVSIMKGVTIGNNVVVAASAVITKDVPDNVLVAGVPAKIIKHI